MIFCSKTLTFIRSSRRVVPITLYRFSGCSETCFSVQVVLPHPGSPMSMIISQSSRLPILQKQKHESLSLETILTTTSLVTTLIKDATCQRRIQCSLVTCPYSTEKRFQFSPKISYLAMPRWAVATCSAAMLKPSGFSNQFSLGLPSLSAPKLISNLTFRLET